VPRDTRLKAVREIFEESSFSDITKNFLGKDGLNDSIVLYALHFRLSHEMSFGRGFPNR